MRLDSRPPSVALVCLCAAAALAVPAEPVDAGVPPPAPRPSGTPAFPSSPSSPSSPGARASAVSPPGWVAPVEGPVVEGFREGRGAFDVGGHAGVDHAAATGATVRAAGAGTVAFVGAVAGAPFVVVDHGSGVRTTYAPVRAGVRRGERVEPGAAFGTVGGRPVRGHPPGRFHFGLRVGGRSVDPRVLSRERAPADVVALVPVGRPTGDAFVAGSPGPDRLLPGRGHGPAGGIDPPWPLAADGGSPLGGLASTVSRGVRSAAAGAAAVPAVAAATVGSAGRLAGRVSGLVARASGGTSALALLAGPRLLAAAARGAADWYGRRSRCSPTAPGPEGFVGTAHHLVAVGGLNSEPAEPAEVRRAGLPAGATLEVPVGELGYHEDRVSYVSYAPGGGPYEASDTHVGPRVAAARMAEQLRAVAERHPGRVVDLIGHSQGAVVVEAFLKLHYAEDPLAYPVVGRVVTLAGPHRGSAVATEAAELTRGPLRRAAASWLAGRIDHPRPDEGAARELAEGSDLVRELRSRPLPFGVPVTTIGAPDDVVVTADATRLEGATHVVADPAGWNDHSAIVADDRVMESVRLALAGAPPACTGLLDAVRARVEPRLIRAAVEAAGEVLDGPLR